MVTASAAATAASIQRYSGSVVVDTFPHSLGLPSNEEKEQDDRLPAATCTASNDQCVLYKAHGQKRPAFASSIFVEQRMFLTKNAHIKRPRNAWIHVSLYI
jgi:hypothetical protein